MKDIQSQHDHRRINIKKVGVKNISYPITVLDKAKKVQRTVANVTMYVNLPHRFKGTHMSRFIEILNQFHGEIDLKSFRLILEEMKRKLEAQAAHMEIDFPYFVKQGREHAGTITLREYNCRMHGALAQEDVLTLEVRVPISLPSLVQRKDGLPQSPGQWGFADIMVRYRHFFWLEDLIQMAEEVIASCQMSAGPAGGDAGLEEACRLQGESGNFLSVEKIAKALGHRLAGHADISWFAVSVENLAEGFSTFASLQWPEPQESKP